MSAPESDWPGPWLQQALGYQAGDLTLFQAALTHRSASGRNNERLEFLGDSVLNLVISSLLYASFPAADEGDLSRLRARLVSGPPLAEIAAAMNLGETLRLGQGELKTGGFRRESILADALEALIGAVFLDQGLPAAEAVVRRLFAQHIAALPAPSTLKDPKTRLQELLQGRGLPLPEYRLTAVTGEPHEQSFAVSATISVPAGTRGLTIPSASQGQQLAASGEGTSRRRAEQVAAGVLLEKLGGPVHE